MSDTNKKVGRDIDELPNKGRKDEEFFSADDSEFYLGFDEEPELEPELGLDNDGDSDEPYYTFIDDESEDHLEFDPDSLDLEEDTDEDSEEDLDEDSEEDLEEDLEEDSGVRRKRVIQIGAIVGAILLAITFSMYLLSNAIGSNGQVDNLDTQQVEVLVGELFSEEGNIKRELKKEELDIAKQYVNNMDEGTLKVELGLKLTQAEEQLSKQTEALSLVQGVMKDGRPYIDLNRNSLPNKVDPFPSNFDREYAQELSTTYYNAYDAIEQAFKLEDELTATINNPATTLVDIDAFRARIEELPASQLKTKLSRVFNNKVEELKRLSTQSKEEESRKLESESLSRIEESKRVEASIMESINEQNRMESESIRVAESESLQQEMERQESIRQESIKEESIRQESIKQESIQESIEESIRVSIEESLRQEQNSTGLGNDESIN